MHYSAAKGVVFAEKCSVFDLTAKMRRDIIKEVFAKVYILHDDEEEYIRCGAYREGLGGEKPLRGVWKQPRSVWTEELGGLCRLHGVSPCTAKRRVSVGRVRGCSPRI